MKKSKIIFWVGFLLILIYDYIRKGVVDVLLTAGLSLCAYGIITTFFDKIEDCNKK